MKSLTILLSFTIVFFAFSCSGPRKSANGSSKGVTAYVNTFIGTFPLTDPKILGYELPKGWRSWAGLTFPGTSLPNAMVQLSPMTEYGSGAGYEYDHDLEGGFSGANYWPDEMEPKDFYQPTDRGFEAKIAERLRYWNARRGQVVGDVSDKAGE